MKVSIPSEARAREGEDGARRCETGAQAELRACQEEAKSARAEGARRLKALQAAQQQLADGGGASSHAAERAQWEATEERLRSTLAAKAQLVADLRGRVRFSLHLFQRSALAVSDREPSMTYFDTGIWVLAMQKFF